jgi:hypothetical protein
MSAHLMRRGARLLCLAASLGTLAAPALGAPAWLAPADLSLPGLDADAAQVAVDPSGAAVAAWIRNDGADTLVQAAVRLPGGAWGAPVTISAAAQSATAPQLAVDAQGGAVVVWSRSDGVNTIIQASRRPPGGAWSAPVDLSAAGRNAEQPQVAVDPAGNAIAVWRRTNGVNWIIQAATRPVLGAWSAPVDVSASGQNAATPQVAIGTGGDALVVFTRTDADGYPIVQAADRPAGAGFVSVFTPAVDLSASQETALNPQVALDPAGNAAAVWRSDGGATVVKAALRPAGGAWSVPQDLSRPGAQVRVPQVAFDAAGDVVAVWERGSGNGLAVQQSTRVAAGTWSSWTAPQTLSTTTPASAPQVAVAPDGDTAVVWQRNYGVGNQVVQAAVRSGTGGAFSAPADISGSGQDALAPAVAVDPDGNVVAAWARGDGVSRVLQAAAYDAAPPAFVSVVVPGRATAGEATTVSAAAADAWSGLGPAPTWTFGDGATATGPSVQHTYLAPGTYTVTVSAPDVLGTAATATRTIVVDPAPAPPPGPPPAPPAPPAAAPPAPEPAPLAPAPPEPPALAPSPPRSSDPAPPPAVRRPPLVSGLAVAAPGGAGRLQFRLARAARVTVSVDRVPRPARSMRPGRVSMPLGPLTAGLHTVSVSVRGTDGRGLILSRTLRVR